MAPLVDNPLIASATLHNPLPLSLHAYVWPFVIIWPIFLRYYLSNDLYDKHIGGQEWTFVWCGSIITAQSLVWLSTNWSVNLKSLFTSTTAKSVQDAKLIKVLPTVNAGSADICTIHRDNAGGKNNISFLFQKRRFLYNSTTNSFKPLAYAIDSDPKPHLEDFQKSRGISSASELSRIRQHYGDNTFDIPVPSFTELFKEHAVAPFFVFQIFCVGLWLLDEYWYYSLFTLFMLVAFESTVVWQRQRTLNEFRGMSIKPYDIYVFRENKWVETHSDKLLPGDLVSVGRTKEDSGVACDMVLVEGSAIVNEAMLSGESTPLLKDSIQLRPSDARLEPEGLDKNAFLYGGTKVLQITHGNSEEERPKLASGVPTPPDNGAMAIVVKTGFETSQGSLVRTMIYSTERVSANNAEALLFILFLLIFAIAASWYVWDEGVKKDRKRSKLLLDCILIVTSVVPPELPMELSLAVNTSLAALSRYAIFCTEPFRIPFAGRVDVACFDKTGTLTGEDLVVEGIAGLGLDRSGTGTPRESDGAHSHITPVLEAGLETTLVLATAHALVKLDEGEVVGDPMEKATLTSLGWTLGKNDILTSRSISGMKALTGGSSATASNSVQVKRRFQFSSALKRQSSVATVTTLHPQSGKKIRSTFVGVKGAPETIMKMLVKVPADYEETFKYFTRKGSRVLSLAYKHLTHDSELGSGKINELKRENVEAELHFAGFLVLHCPLKDDAKSSVRMLNESSHRVVMITGDNPLTAVHVAHEVEIVDRDVLILDAPEHDDTGDKLVWRSVDDHISIPVDPTKPLDPKILESNDLCVTGYALAKFKGQIALPSIYRHVWVYARVSPKQKEEILMGLKDLGYYTLMAGDGTNDVGALKQAHIGVALLNGSQQDLNKIAEHFRNTKMREMYDKQCAMLKRFNQPSPPVPILIAHLYPPGPTNPHYEKAMERERLKKGGDGAVPQQNHPAAPEEPQRKPNLAEKFTQSMMDQELEEDGPPTIKLGDASVAAPFTSKLSNVIAIPNIIRQGRCTLVATIQMYKILALNCLISAYSLSVLYLEGIKFGDGQVTISGMLMSVCFLSISRAKSVEGLSKERPQPNIFNFYIIGSILGQFAVHIVTLIYIARFCDKLAPRDPDVDLEKEFTPSLLNSAVYLLQLIQQISTFAINYQGRPFREALSENRGMYWGIIGVSAIAFSCSTEFIPEINEKMRLVPFTSEFKTTMTVTMIVDYVGCYVIEKALKALFSDYKPKDIAVRRPDQLAREQKRIADAQAEAIRIEEEKAAKEVEALEAQLRVKALAPALTLQNLESSPRSDSSTPPGAVPTSSYRQGRKAKKWRDKGAYLFESNAFAFPSHASCFFNLKLRNPTDIPVSLGWFNGEGYSVWMARKRTFNEELLTGWHRQDQHRWRNEARRLLPTYHEEGIPSAIAPPEVTKVALRLRYLIEECVPCELEESAITRAHSAIITPHVIKAAKEAGGNEYAACVVYALLVNKRWFKKQALIELWDADLHNIRATACEVIAKRLIEAEDNQDYLLQDILLKRYSIMIDGEETAAANVIERAVDLHALRVTGSSGYQKCVNYLWRGWLVQDENDPSCFIDYKKKDNTSYWAHVDPDRMRAPLYQNATQIIFSLVYLGLYTGAISTVNHSGDLDIVEIILYIFTFGFLCDEFSKFWKVGWFYIGFWNVFNLVLYGLLTTSLVMRFIALSHPLVDGEPKGARGTFNELSYNFLAFSAPMFWIRLLLYLDSLRFFGAMLVVLKVMMKESLIFFALLIVVIVGFLQAFIGMDNADSNADATIYIIQAMANAVMGSPDFSGFDNFAPPFGIILYYIFSFLIMVILLNILIALYNSAYEDVTENAVDEYMALFAQKTMQFVRAPDENVFIAPLNLIEIFFLIIPFEWWMPRDMYAKLNDFIMAIVYSPLLFVAAYFETKSAISVKSNRCRGEEDDDTIEEWEQMSGEVDFESEGWNKKVASVKPDVEQDAATIEVKKLRGEVSELKEMLEKLLEKAG